MWYVMQVRTGSEQQICLQCESRISPELLEKCFVPFYEEKKKMQGKWQLLKKKLFPGYVFFITNRLEALYQEMRRVDGILRILGTGREMVALTEKEVAFLERFGGEKQVVPMSEGVIVGDRVIVTDGPLEGMETWIRKVDRHKRKCWVEVEMFGRRQLVMVGLEILEKR